ncbi:rRNA maturation RNase YbeY [Candidatus Falkowbacteria bacterium]|jgi:probable rRNA maturation factor|nr:rRNA maturation RNase YbeY [Candidatus Falkowbacteria bacterium]MBT4433345.1 rRNA maturation RNase YbeY [Candidatus Falkowbacteria bacterium]
MITWEVNQKAGRKIPKDFFNNIIKTSFKILKIKKANVSIAIVKEEDIKKANKIYRHKDKVTDVLSFIYEKNPLEGEILLCYKKVSEQAKEKGHSLNQETKILLIHGLVHLVGYDHKKKRQANEMKQIEAMILKKI